MYLCSSLDKIRGFHDVIVMLNERIDELEVQKKVRDLEMCGCLNWSRLRHVALLEAG